MNVKNTAKKIVALASGAGMVGATLMGAFALDLADYPSVVMTGNSFDGKLVIGVNAATQDLLGAIDIAASLQASSVTNVPLSGATTSTVIEGDAKQIRDASDILEIGEQLGNVINSLTDGDLAMLQSGRVTTSKGSTEFNQILDLDQGAAATSNIVLLAENDDDEAGMYLLFEKDEPIFEYELEFTSGLESDIEDNEAEDLEDETLFMLGQYYSVVDSSVTGDAPLEVQLDLIAGDVVDTLQEGETRTYNVDDTTYEITVLVIGESGGDQQVKFLINGEVSDALEAGETDTLSNGLEIGVREIIETTAYRESDPSSIVEFYLGANKIEFVDTNVGNTAMDGSVTINTENIEDADLDIRAQNVSGDLRINSINYQLNADAADGNDVYIGEGMGLRELLDEPEGMLNAQWDFVFAGISEPTTSVISFDPSGDDEYTFTFTNKKGDEYSVPYAEITAATTANLGDADDDFFVFEKWFDEGAGDVLDDSETFIIGDDDYFLVTDDDADNDGDSFILQWTDVDTDDNTLTFENVGSGEDLVVQWTTLYSGAADSLNASVVAGTASGDIQVGGTNFDYWLRNTSGTYTLAVDMDNDGTLAGSSAAIGDDAVEDNRTDIVSVVVKGGGILRLSNQTSALTDTWYATLTTLDDDIDSDGVNHAVNLTFTAAASELDVDMSAATSNFYVQDVDDEDREYGLTKYGTWFDITDDTSEADTLVIEYPHEQVEAIVYVVGGDVQQSTTTTGGSTAHRINQLPVGIAVLDTEVSVDDENLIVVGGPCANSVAAELLGNPAVCTEGFTPGMGMIRIFDTGNNVAVLVAGYSARDTVETSYVLAQYEDFMDDLVGEEVEVVIASAGDVTVRQAMEVEEEDEEEETEE